MISSFLHVLLFFLSSLFSPTNKRNYSLLNICFTLYVPKKIFAPVEIKNDKSITMFKAVIAARLNWEMGCQDKDAQYWYWDGVWWLNNFPVGSGVKANTEAWQYSHGELIYWWLDQYNNGYLTCPPRD